MTLFSRIIAGDIPCHKIAENDKFFAFLDINPLQRGHTLVVPKKETDYFFDLDDQELGGMMAFAKQIAHAIQKYTGCRKVGVSVIGLEVPHAHVHLVPMFQLHDMDFSRKSEPSEEELKEVARGIIAYL